jgi:lipoprotein-anchoring transpeptidase ErfK/SrfK
MLTRLGPARLAIAAALGVIALVASSCTTNSDDSAGSGSLAPTDASSASGSSAAGSTGSAAAPTATPTPTPTPTPTSPVHASLLESDGATYGVGMPIIMRFDASVTDTAAMQKAITVTVNGAPAGGAWYFFTPTEAHYRTQNYWPAHADIKMNAPLTGVSAGAGLTFDDSLTLQMNTGAANISTVDATTLEMTVTSDGAVVKTIPVSLGAAATPTYSGTKVVMEKDNPEHMVGPGYDEEVPYSLRITNSGEFVHAAAWNSRIGQASTSNGCTNLTTDDAIWMFNFSLIGDVVIYPNAPGGTMPSWDGYGDWNLDWSTWLAGGAV